MKGYYSVNVYFVLIPSIKKYMQFETEKAYREYIVEIEGL